MNSTLILVNKYFQQRVHRRSFHISFPEVIQRGGLSGRSICSPVVRSRYEVISKLKSKIVSRTKFSAGSFRAFGEEIRRQNKRERLSQTNNGKHFGPIKWPEVVSALATLVTFGFAFFVDLIIFLLEESGIPGRSAGMGTF